MNLVYSDQIEFEVDRHYGQQVLVFVLNKSNLTIKLFIVII